MERSKACHLWQAFACGNTRPRRSCGGLPSGLLVDTLRLVSLGFQSRSQLAAENLFLRKQLALYAERRVKARRADDATRIILVVLARLIDWRAALTIVQPDTLIRWHRKGFRLFWRWKSRAPGRPSVPADLQQLIAAMARANATWGEERIAAELLLKLGHPRVSAYRSGATCHEEGDLGIAGRPNSGAPSCAITRVPCSRAISS